MEILYSKEREGGEPEVGTNQRFVDSKLPLIIKKKSRTKYIKGNMFLGAMLV